MTIKTSEQNFLQNLLANELSLKGGYLNIPALGHAKILESDLQEQSILYALGRGWAEVLHEVPVAKESALPAIELEMTEPYKGLTFEELQAEQAAKAKEKEDAANAKEAAAAAKAAEEVKVDTSPIEEFFPGKPADVEPVKETKAKKTK